MINIKRRYARGNRLTHLILGCGYCDTDDHDDSLEHSGIARGEEHDRRPREPSSPYALDFIRKCEGKDQKRCVGSPYDRETEVYSFARIGGTSLLTGGGDTVVLHENGRKFRAW